MNTNRRQEFRSSGGEVRRGASTAPSANPETSPPRFTQFDVSVRQEDWVVRLWHPLFAPHRIRSAVCGSIGETPEHTIATNTTRFTPMRAEVTGIILSIAERLAGSGFWEGARASIASRHSGQILCGSPGGGSSRPQLMQF